MIKAKALIINPEYYSSRQFQVIKGNQTYNSLGMKFDRMKDLPQDVEVKSFSFGLVRIDDVKANSII